MRIPALAVVAMAVAAVPAQAADPVLVAAGDVACDPVESSFAFNGGNGRIHPEETPGRCHAKYTGDLIEAIDPGYVLGVGDLQNNDGELAKFNQSYGPSWGRFMAKTYPVPGNHEYQDGPAEGYFDYFGARLRQLGPDADDAAKGWYSFNIPVEGGRTWHVVALNSECAAGQAAERGWLNGCAAGSPQEQWLRADLAADNSDCTLAFWHHPLLSSGGNGSTPTSGDSPEMKPIWDALYADNADVVLAGHRQNYERMAPQDPDGVPRPGRGIREWVVGTGGHILHSLPQPEVPPKPASEVLDNTRFGVLKLTLHGPADGHPRGWYEWQFVGDAVSGSSFSDSGSGDCVGPPLPGPTPPQQATPNPAPVVAKDTLAPAISPLRVSRRRFRIGRGTVFGFTLSEAATATLRIDRKGRRRYLRSGSFKRRLAKGRARVRFSGRLRGKGLKAGLYRLTITARDPAGNTARPRTLFFRILR